MAKKAGRKKRRRSKEHVLLHPATLAMVSRIGQCNKPPIQWHRMPDGSWLECFLMSDCTYGNCVPVDASQVPPEVRSRFSG